jgi:diguanylate cyclase (GGDEF)-like protein
LLLVSSFLECKPDGIICIEETLDVDYVIGFPCDDLKILAAVGEYNSSVGCHLRDTCLQKDIVQIIWLALKTRQSQFDDHYTVLFLETTEGKAVVALVNSGREMDDNDRHLLNVYASKISIALANAIHYQKMISFEEAATTDFLTRLNNRRQLIRLGIPLVAVAGRAQTPLAVAMIDIDHFKRINDNFGHDAGDLVLKDIATLLTERFRSSDIVSRYGGEEFCVIASNLDSHQAYDLFDSFREAVASQCTRLPDGTELRVTISIGITTVRLEQLESMISIADNALYTAKTMGRNRVVIDSEQN